MRIEGGSPEKSAAEEISEGFEKGHTLIYDLALKRFQAIETKDVSTFSDPEMYISSLDQIIEPILSALKEEKDCGGAMGVILSIHDRLPKRKKIAKAFGQKNITNPLSNLITSIDQQMREVLADADFDAFGETLVECEQEDLIQLFTDCAQVNTHLTFKILDQIEKALDAQTKSQRIEQPFEDVANTLQESREKGKMLAYDVPSYRFHCYKKEELKKLKPISQVITDPVSTRILAVRYLKKVNTPKAHELIAHFNTIV